MQLVHEDVDIVIVGAGLAGLTTALALHRLGLRSLVLESSQSLRVTGFALTLWTNAWKALDAVGIGDSLRQKSIQITGFKMASPGTGVFTSGQALDKDGKFKGYESRCVRRKDLLETLEKELPPGTIRYSSKVSTIDELNQFKLVHLVDGSILKTKVLIGCDGVNSIVARWLDLAAPVSVGRSAIRGLVNFPNGSGLDPMSHLSFEGGTRFGFRPVDDKTVYWFCTFTSSQEEEELQENPMNMKQFVQNRINKMPREAQDVVEKTPLSSISYSPLKLRLPWHVLFGNIVKENVCVAGDALHPMTPDINQGGCSALEDAIVLGRCLGEAFLKKQSEKDDGFERITKSLVKYGRERRWRSVILVSVAYCVGFIQQSKGKMMSFLRKVWLSNYTSYALLKMASFDCGDLVL